MAFTLAQPLLMTRVIRYLDGDEISDPPAIGYGLIAAYFLLYLGIAVSTSKSVLSRDRCL